MSASQNLIHCSCGLKSRHYLLVDHLSNKLEIRVKIFIPHNFYTVIFGKDRHLLHGRRIDLRKDFNQ